MSLYPQHKISHICQRLGLSGSQLRHRIESSSRDSSDGGFVLAATDIDRSIQKPIPEIELGVEGVNPMVAISQALNGTFDFSGE